VPGGNAVEDIAAPGQAGDFVERSRMHGHAAETDGGMLGQDVGRSLIVLQGDNDIARSQDVGDARAREAQGIVDEIALATGEGAFPGAFFGEENDLPVGRTFVGLDPDDGADDEVAEVGERTEDSAHPVQGKSSVLLQGGAVNDSQIFRDNFGEDENSKRHQRGDNAEGGIAKEACGHAADEDSAQSVGNGIEGEDGRNGLLHVITRVFKEFSAPRISFLERLDLCSGRAEEHSLKE
jgi:hypothetical protein